MPQLYPAGQHGLAIHTFNPPDDAQTLMTERRVVPGHRELDRIHAFKHCRKKPRRIRHTAVDAAKRIGHVLELLQSGETGRALAEFEVRSRPMTVFNSRMPLRQYSIE